MVRLKRASVALVFVLCLTPAWVLAQSVRAVRVNEIEVHKAPTTSSPVIGRASRGRTVEVTREVGDWVQVVWPSAPDKMGFVRVKFGSVPLEALGDGPSAAAPRPDAADAARSSTDSRVYASAGPGVATSAAPPERAALAPNPITYQLPAHTLGFGARVDGPFRAPGISGRLWSARGFGVQLEMSRSATTSDLSPGRLTMFQVSPSVLYSRRGIARSTVWVRPYVGSGIDLAHSTLSNVTPGMSMHDTTIGVRAFGGGEVTFANAPQVAVSADLGYRWLDAPVGGFDVGGLRASISAHWYVR